jgi:hypothetical protein
MLFLASAGVALSIVLAVVLVRRALPILCAAVAGWLAWFLTHDIATVGVVSTAALLAMCCLADAAASQVITRQLTIGVEIVAAVLVAGSLAFLLAAGPGPSIVWVVTVSAIAAMVIVVRWRSRSF